MNIQDMHPELTDFSLNLLNAYSHNLSAVKKYDEESGEFYLELVTKFSAWIRDKDDHPVFAQDHKEVCWRCDNREDFDALMKFLKIVGNNVFAAKAKKPLANC